MYGKKEANTIGNKTLAPTILMNSLGVAFIAFMYYNGIKEVICSVYV